jgi:hypothetical protein
MNLSLTSYLAVERNLCPKIGDQIQIGPITYLVIGQEYNYDAWILGTSPFDAALYQTRYLIQHAYMHLLRFLLRNGFGYCPETCIPTRRNVSFRRRWTLKRKIYSEEPYRGCGEPQCPGYAG